MLVKLCFSLHFIPLDPDPRTQMNPDPTGSGSASLINTRPDKLLLSTTRRDV